MNRRIWHIPLLFALCCFVVLVAMGWMTTLVVRLDRQDAEAQRQAEREEDSRLALWRMDSALAPVVSQEAARPYFHFTSLYPVIAGYTSKLQAVEDGQLLTPSPLVTFESPLIHLHFQVDGDGRVSSPQVPEGTLLRALQERLGSSWQRPNAARGLGQCAEFVTREELRSRGAVLCGDHFELASKALPADRQSAGPEEVPPTGIATKQMGRGRVAMDQQELRNVAEFSQRQRTVDLTSKLSQSGSSYLTPKVAPGAPPHGADRPPSAGGVAGTSAESPDSVPVLISGVVQATPFAWAWVENELFYLRRVRFGDQEVLQGCWFDWPAIQATLRDEIGDLLPNATLRPVEQPMLRGTKPPGSKTTYTLASLPVELLPGEVTAGDDRLSQSTRNALAIAWTCLSLAIVAVGILLRGSVTLSERRADFVSAVTHELRTPLTTFRLYLDMLISGRVAEPTRRQEYLATLQSESERLGHLVENVLRYARLERGQHPEGHEAWRVEMLLERCSGRLRRRVEQSEMRLSISTTPEARGVEIETDAVAVEQILYNLVDNAGKYAATGTSTEIALNVQVANGCCEWRVIDSGPGLTAEARRKLFQPFSKSAQRAANSAAGVGLGLALSRRLARELGGDLLHEPTSQGTCFVLRLPCRPR